MMKRLLVSLICGLGALAPVLALAAAPTGVDAALVARGKGVATAADCMACHSAVHGKPYAGGMPLVSPLGKIYSTNITPSVTRGIGNWSEAEFGKAIRDGVLPNGAHLYPAMPYASYHGMTDDDVHALYAYFKHDVKAVDDTPLHTTELKFPFGIRESMMGWNLLFLRGEHGVAPAAGADQKIDRGRYLVNVLGHCGECHTPRGQLMAMDQSRYLGGGSVGGWHASNLTSDPVSGIGAWSEAELVTYLRTGHVAGKGQAAGGMAEAVTNSLRFMGDSDLHAVAAYLKQVPPLGNPGQVAAAHTHGTVAGQQYDFDQPASAKTFDDAAAGLAQAPAQLANRGDLGLVSGAALYEAACATCHQASGSGTKDQYYPSLYHNTATGGQRADNLVMAILHGVERRGADGATSMPAFANDLDDKQVAAIANYVLTRFGNPAVSVTPADVTELRSGGPAPAIQRYMPWLMVIGALFVIAILALVVILMRRRRPAAR